MTNDTITCDWRLTKLAEAIASDVAAEVKEYGGDAYDLAHEYVDGSEHVIYHYKAHAICQNCNTDAGEDFASECGEPEDGWSYNGFAIAIAFGELHHRVLVALQELEADDA